jgi:nitrile hydratase
MSNATDHDHHHDHGGHGPHGPPADEGGPPTEFEILEQAVRELLIEKGVTTAGALQRQIENQESRSPALGAKVVARAWVDPAYRQMLLTDARAALQVMNIDASNTLELVVLENTAELHHVVVCTLCSCYPRMILGVPPAWYKSKAYRSRVVVDPRGVLGEFGLDLPDSVRVRVVDSTADLRYLILGQRPAGTAGWTEEQLARLVTRDSMVGVGRPLTPAELASQAAADASLSR